MANFFNKAKKIEIIQVIVIYSIFIITGLLVFKDYGVSVDEWELRVLGFANLKYVIETILQGSAENLDKILPIPSLSSHLGTHGALFALPTAYLEYFFNIEDSKNYYLFRHYLNHIIFIIANFYFFLLVKNKYNNFFYGILGSLFLFLSPRIFAESFYNHKDLLFLSLFIINLYYAINFLKSPSVKNSLLFSLTTALSIDIRIMGIIIAPLVILLCFLKYLRNKKFKVFKGITIYLICFPLITILFWPYLWENPIINFLETFKILGDYKWEGYNFYLGKYYLSSNLPWHYPLVWISITTPFFYLFLFLYGFTNYSLRIKNRLFKIEKGNKLDDFWRGDIELQDLIYFILFLVPILIVIIFNSTLYNAWRHLYFVYPCFLMISLQGLYLINLKYFKKKEFLFKSLIALLIIQIIYVMIKNHPYQNVYFNFLAGKNIEKKFELDYWGLSNKQAFEYILNNDDKNRILIGSAGSISLNNSKQILNSKKRNRIHIIENSKADYIIDNYINWRGTYKSKRQEIPDDFIIYKEIFTGGNKIISIYKKK
tara:strand:+ start:2305 stop:3930 length:1626 start_codon:yes stop_codon:yes gene_type:complete